MSRTRRGRFICDSDPQTKRLFNRSIRRKSRSALRRKDPEDYEIPNGRAYRKMNESWSIKDFKFSIEKDYEEFYRKWRWLFETDDECWSEFNKRLYR